MDTYVGSYHPESGTGKAIITPYGSGTARNAKKDARSHLHHALYYPALHCLDPLMSQPSTAISAWRRYSPKESGNKDYQDPGVSDHTRRPSVGM